MCNCNTQVGARKRGTKNICRRAAKRFPNWWKVEIHRFKKLSEPKNKKHEESYTNLLKLAKTNDKEI